MEKLQGMWKSFVGFLTEFNMDRIAEVLRDLEWALLLKNPWVWLGAFVFLVFVLLKRALKTLVFAVSLVLFAMLLQHTLPPPGQSLQLSNLLQFIGGSLVLAVVNLYYLILGSHK